MLEGSQIRLALPNHELVRVLKPGRTYVVRQSLSGQLWVLKQNRGSEPIRAAGRRLNFINRVHHPLVSAGYRSLEIEQTAYTLREYVEGSPASQALLVGTIPSNAAVAVGFALQVAVGLRALHRAGVVHGNLHPNNLIVDPSGRIRLVDLGEFPASPFQYDDTAASGIYLSPEQLKGWTASPRSDLFSLGVILYQLLTGQHPFSGTNLIEVAQRTLYETPPTLSLLGPELSTQFNALVNRLLAKRPYQRFASAPVQLLLTLWRKTAPSAGKLPENSASLTIEDGGHWTWRGAGAAAAQTAASGLRLVVPAASRWRTLNRSTKALLLILCVLLPTTTLVVMNRSRDRVLANEIAADLSAGRATQAHQRLQAEVQKRGEDPLLHKLLGDVSCARKDYANCLKHYRAATAGTRRFSSDETLQRNVLGLLASAGNSTNLTQLLAQLDNNIDSTLVEGTQSEDYWRRWNSVRALEARGASSKIDYQFVYSMDLLHGSRCETRRAAANKLAQLKDRKALPFLKRAQATVDGSFFERLCMGDSVKRAIKAIDEGS